MSDLTDSVASWLREGEAERQAHFQSYAHALSQAGYIVRKLTHIADEECKRAGIDPLERHALLQIWGRQPPFLTVSTLAERLDIAPAFASRLVTELESKGYVDRHRSHRDRRVIWVKISPAGIEILKTVDGQIRRHVDYFRSQLEMEQRLPALAAFSEYIGIKPGSSIATAIATEIEGLLDTPDAEAG